MPIRWTQRPIEDELARPSPGPRQGVSAGARLLLAGSLLSLGCEPADPPRLEAPTAQAPTEASAAEVTLTPDALGLRARFVFDAPIQTVRFADVVTARRDRWSSATEGVRLVDDELRAEAPVSSLEVLIEPDTQRYDRIYPSLTRVGEGVVLYGPAVALLDLQTSVSTEADAYPPGDPLEGYVYLGPLPDLAPGGSFSLIGADTVAPWLSEAIEDAADESLGWYARVLGRPTRPPALFVTGDGVGPTGFHGDVTDNAVIFLRFAGDAWREPDAGAGRQIATFVRHEAFHLWNGRNAADTPPWLHEGGAEYAALLGAVRAGALSQDRAIEQVAHRVAKCRRTLGEDPITALPAKGSAVYDCGVALQWLADVEARHASGGERHTFTLWTALLDAAEARGGYTVADFRDATGPLVATLLDAQPGGRWPLLLEALAKHGVVAGEQPSAADHRTAAIRHLLEEDCGDVARGYWSEPSALRLDTGDRCGALHGDPEVVGVEGHDLFAAPEDAFEALSRRCAAGGPVRVDVRNAEPRRVPCSRAPSLPPGFNIASAPDLAL